MATQNLLSMKTQSLPTQSEIFAIGYAKKKNIDMLMLSDETAINKYWKRTLKWLNSFLKKDDNYVIIENENFDIWSVVNEQNNSNIVIFTKKGHSFQNLKLKNNNKYFIFSENKKIENRLNFYSNVIFNHCKFSKVNSEYIKKNIKKYSDVIFEKGRSAILVSILFPKKKTQERIRLHYYQNICLLNETSSSGLWRKNRLGFFKVYWMAILKFYHYQVFFILMNI